MCQRSRWLCGHDVSVVTDFADTVYAVTRFSRISSWKQTISRNRFASSYGVLSNLYAQKNNDQKSCDSTPLSKKKQSKGKKPSGSNLFLFCFCTPCFDKKEERKRGEYWAHHFQQQWATTIRLTSIRFIFLWTFGKQKTCRTHTKIHFLTWHRDPKICNNKSL